MPCSSISRAIPAAWSSTSSSSASASARADDAMPPPERAISSYGDAGHLLLVLPRAPPRERQVGVAVDEPRQHGAAAWRPRRTSAFASSSSAAMRSPRTVTEPGVEPHRRRAVAAHVGQPVLRRPENLCGAAQRDAHAIGIRTPCRSAASSASG